MGCWEVVENWLACNEFYFWVDTLEGPLTAWEPFLQKWGLQVVKPCTQTQMKHKMFSSADICFSQGCEIWWMSQSEGLESLSMSLTWPSMLQAEESSVEIVYKSLEGSPVGGSQVCDIQLDCFGLESFGPSQPGNPFEHHGLRCWEEWAICVPQMRLKGDEVWEGLLSCPICLMGQGSEAMPRKESTLADRLVCVWYHAAGGALNMISSASRTQL